MEESGHGKSGKVPTGKKETTTSVGICGTGRVAGRRPGSKSPTPLVGYVIRRGVPAEAKTLQPERQELLGLLDDVLAGLDQVLGVLLVDLEDFLVSNCLLPLGSTIFVLFCTRKNGLGWDNFMCEANEGHGLKIKSWMRGYITWGLPAIILIIFVMGLISFF